MLDKDSSYELNISFGGPDNPVTPTKNNKHSFIIAGIGYVGLVLVIMFGREFSNIVLSLLLKVKSISP